MTTLVVDTDVVSFLLKGDTRAQLYRPHLQNKTLALSLSVQDAWIAATALRHSCPLVTHNSDDFSDIAGLKVISEE
jgi:predicted nucleic acid-binding protein